jgi:hypothetical protein
LNLFEKIKIEEKIETLVTEIYVEYPVHTRGFLSGGKVFGA